MCSSVDSVVITERNATRLAGHIVRGAAPVDEDQRTRRASVMSLVRDTRGGKDYDSTFGTRMRGEGVWARLIAQRLAQAKRRFGLDGDRRELDVSQFRKPLPSSRVGQGDLFG